MQLKKTNISLPKIDHVTYPITLPISQKKLRFRSYLKKDDKILLQALEENSESEMYEATKQVIQNCITEGQVSIDDLPVLDVQYFFFQLRKRSVGPQIRLTLKCQNSVPVDENSTETKLCNSTKGVGIDIDSLSFDPISKEDFVIKLTDSVGVKMKLPTYKVSQKINELKKNSESNFEVNIIALLIESIFNGDEVVTNFAEDDLIDFIENLDYSQYSRLSDFLNKIPYYKHSLDFKCSKCGHEEVVNFEGFESFFV